MILSELERQGMKGQLFWKISIITHLYIILPISIKFAVVTLEARGVFLEGQTRGRGPSVPNFGDALPTPTGFDLERLNSV